MASVDARTWAKQQQEDGERARLFTAVAEWTGAQTVLYPGSFADVAPSFVFPSVTYVDVDDRARRFFADEAAVREIIDAELGPARPGVPEPEFAFIAADYRDDLGLPDASFDLLVSLYAGFISEACTRYLRLGGTLLVNPSHGDAAMASIDDRYRLSAVITSARGRYRVGDHDLDSYLQPKVHQEVTVERLHELGRGIGYTRSAFAYLFTRVA